MFAALLTVTDKDNKTATKSTDTNGKIVVPVKTSGGSSGGSSRPSGGGSGGGGSSWGGQVNIPVVSGQVTHKLYIVGYTDGTFQPDGDMTRAEAAAIFARLIAEKKGEKISGTKTNFKDVSKNEWYSSYISYLEKYDVIKGYEDKTFKPDGNVTRAEFISMSVRFYGLFEKVTYPKNTTKYTDINGSHWAVKDVSFATSVKWLHGYADGTFKADNKITRAEVVTVVNRVTDREADTEYINKNMSAVNKFTDLKDKAYWAFYEIMEASTTHKANIKSDTEIWVSK